MPAPPRRAVALDQTSTESLLALGLADRMAGTAYLKTVVAPQYLADYRKVPVLSPKALTAEQLRAANPDLVVSGFASAYTRDKVGTRAELAALGVPTFVSAADCPAPDRSPFDQLAGDLDQLGRIFGVGDRAAALVAEQRAAVDRAAASRSRTHGSPTVVWLYSTIKGVPYVAGRGGMPSAMSALAGARNAFNDLDQAWPEVSWEEIARRAPDVIVIGDLSERGAPGDKAAEKIAALRGHPVLSKLPAVANERFITVPGIELDPSVRSTHALGLFLDGLVALGHRDAG
ncbi:ABC transporter substrate-binding protein [Longispora sp. K20-0274]|uniref:ABC transporter substrate-binding protein n=1 Tax=Longispora sp. K20-0274 TaxID=3088255 RepID=UPI00399AC5D0